MRPRLVLRIGDGTLRIHAYRGIRDRLVWSGEARYGDLADMSEGIAALAASPELPRRSKRVDIRLEPPLAQVRTLSDLPPVKKRALPSLVAHQRSRFFRKNGTPLVTDAEWLNGARAGTPGPKRTARAAAAPLDLVQAVDAGAAGAGFTVNRIAPALEAKTRLDLSPPELKRARRRRAWISVRRLGWAAAALWGLAGVLFTAKLAQERRALTREVAALEEPVQALLALRREVNQAGLMLSTIEKAAARRGAILSQLAHAAAALPDSAYLSSIVIDSAGGRIAGLAERAVHVVAALEETGVLMAPRLEGRPLREGRGRSEWERFTIAFGEERSR